jgi:molybdenum cofactor guanylyltransferase
MDGSPSVAAVAGVILAGGRARRFQGLNKAALAVGGQRIIDRQMAALRPVTAEQLIVTHTPEPFASLGVPIVGDRIPGAGPLGGLHTALTTVQCARVLVLACDLPFVQAAFLRYLIARAPDADVVVPRTADGLQPLCAVYATRLAVVVREQIDHGLLALHDLIARVRCVEVGPAALAPFDPDGRLLANVNTPREYEALEDAPHQRVSHPPEIS